MSCLTLTGQVGFQSTLPTRGSDKPTTVKGVINSAFQSTLPTRGSDASPVDAYCSIDMFQSTLPTRGSDDRKGGGLADNIGVSIHAPHEGERL